MTMRINKKKEKRTMEKMKRKNRDQNMMKKILKTFLTLSLGTTERTNYTMTPLQQ
jgi:hypothetical protein